MTPPNSDSTTCIVRDLGRADALIQPNAESRPTKFWSCIGDDRMGRVSPRLGRSAPRSRSSERGQSPCGHFVDSRDLIAQQAQTIRLRAVYRDCAIMPTLKSAHVALRSSSLLFARQVKVLLSTASPPQRPDRYVHHARLFVAHSLPMRRLCTTNNVRTVTTARPRERAGRRPPCCARAR